MPIHHCPVCDKAFDPEESLSLPFCSERCRWIDLGRWLDEEYGLAQDPDEEPDDDAP